MAKWKFRFQSILNIKNTEKNLLEQKLSKIFSRKEKLLSKLHMYEQTILENEEGILVKMKEGISPNLFAFYEEYNEYLRKECKMIKSEIKKLNDEIKKTQKKLIEKIKEIKILEKLKEKDFFKFQKSLEHKEQVFLDEIATIRYKRNTL